MLDPETKAIVVGALFYDTKSNGSHGRALRVDVPQLGLLKGDRLEPSFSLADVSKLETLEVPCDLLFLAPTERDPFKASVPLNCRAWRVLEDAGPRHFTHAAFGVR